MKRITILGATGSIGTSTLDLIERNRDGFEVLALTANSDVDGLAAAAKRVGAKRAVVADATRYEALKAALADTGIEAAAGADAVCDAARMGADWTMAAIVGCAGLKPVMAAIESGGTLALAKVVESHGILKIIYRLDASWSVGVWVIRVSILIDVAIHVRRRRHVASRRSRSITVGYGRIADRDTG